MNDCSIKKKGNIKKSVQTFYSSKSLNTTNKENIT